jgi:hypothetical protein
MKAKVNFLITANIFDKKGPLELLKKAFDLI